MTTICNILTLYIVLYRKQAKNIPVPSVRGSFISALFLAVAVHDQTHFSGIDLALIDVDTVIIKRNIFLAEQQKLHIAHGQAAIVLDNAMPGGFIGAELHGEADELCLAGSINDFGNIDEAHNAAFRNIGYDLVYILKKSHGD